MCAKSLGHIRTAAADLDDGEQDVAYLSARAAEFRRNAQPEYTGLPDRFDGLVLQNPLPLGDGIVAAQRRHDLG